MLKKVISGGQTGADIAAVDAAIECSFPYGGMIPANRRCETGKISPSYVDFEVSVIAGYPLRTKMNVKHSHGTVIFFKDVLSGGSKLTKDLTVEYKRPCLVIDINKAQGFIRVDEEITQFIAEKNIEILNVAGSRESRVPGIYNFVKKVIEDVIRNHTY